MLASCGLKPGGVLEVVVAGIRVIAQCGSKSDAKWPWERDKSDHNPKGLTVTTKFKFQLWRQSGQWWWPQDFELRFQYIIAQAGVGLLVPRLRVRNAHCDTLPALHSGFLQECWRHILHRKSKSWFPVQCQRFLHSFQPTTLTLAITHWFLYEDLTSTYTCLIRNQDV